MLREFANMRVITGQSYSLTDSSNERVNSQEENQIEAISNGLSSIDLNSLS